MDAREGEPQQIKMQSVICRRQRALALTVGLIFLVNSMAMGFSSPAVPLLLQDPKMKVLDEELSWIASIMPGGAILGSLVSSWLVDKYGRRNLLFASMCLFAGSWLQIALSGNITKIIYARFVGGICVGLTSSSGPVYLAETIQETYRPSQGIILTVLGTSGMFLMSILVMVVNWRGLAWAGAILSLLPLIFLAFLPESPYHLNKFSAMKSLNAYEWLLGTKIDAGVKFKEMNVAQNLAQKTENEFLFNSINGYPTCVLITLHVIQQLTGINVFIFFSTTIFSRIGGHSFGESCTVVMTGVNTVSNLIVSLFQGHNRRKLLLLISTRVIVPSLWISALFFMMKDSKRFGADFSFYVNAVPTLTMMAYIAFFAVGWGPVPFLFMGEGLPSSIRGNVAGKAMALNWASAFFVTKSFLWLSGYIGYGWLFLIYSMFTTAGGLIMEIYMPETLGKSVSEMDAYYIKLRKASH